MEYDEEVYAYFFITDYECNHNEITDLLKINPNKIECKGEISSSGRQRKENYWIIDSKSLKNEIYIHNHIKYVIDIIYNKKNIIYDLSKKYYCGINCVGKYYPPTFGMHLDVDLIKKIYELNVPVDFDIYWIDPTIDYSSM